MEAPESSHVAYMQKAIEIAKQNPRAPFGCLLVDPRTGDIVAKGVNQSARNPTLHGEMDAINNYACQNGQDWNELILYTTAEPCCMCQGAILWAGISQVVFGTSIPRLKELGWKQIDIPASEVIARSWSPSLNVIGSVCAPDCDQLFIDAA